MGRLWLRRLQQLFGRQLQVEQRLLRPLLAASNPAAKRSKTSTSGFMADSSDEASDEGDNPEQEDTDELTAYLEVEQLKVKKTDPESIVGDCWWLINNKAKFPNLEVMARQYLGVPASSASVERLFSAVGIAYSAKRQSADAKTVADIMFTKTNLPSRAETKSYSRYAAYIDLDYYTGY